MKRLLALLFFASSTLHAVDLTLTSPLDYQVVQRTSPGNGLLRNAGEVSGVVVLAVEKRATDTKGLLPGSRTESEHDIESRA